ncbi:ROK family protein [Thermaerobacter marianensis DSM 12885]|uniref:ROK family protein n=1 Tax=Thermaerobacter marianensis (strain ATCC 700841 / DSM 12885 / JCM 10246 / 7p75a) TaxID=644966 RepID=E6SGQ5_THEM7|nr:ROK family transcriptional regulator [Thermaerobacter marianensis]ADU51639.1 ROK family protein [Thermaerobacter marianensis DSM 12885]
MGRRPPQREPGVPAPSGRPQLLRLHNRTLILSLLRQRPMSRAELSRQAGLALPTVSRLVDQLIRDGLVAEGQKQATGGRHATELRLRAEAGFVLGAELGRERIRVILSDLQGDVRAQAEKPRGETAEQDIAYLAAMAGALLGDAGVEPRRLMGIGVGVPGPLDPAAGTVIAPPNFRGWSYVPLRQLLQQRFRVPVWIENDANAGALAEFLLSHPQARNLVYVMADAGVGAGLVIERQLYRGEGGAGELGHCPIQLGGPPCPCGRRGCVEAIASTDAMVARYHELHGQGASGSGGPADFAALLAAEAGGDRRARAVLARGGRALGAGLAILANLLSPEVVVLGGRSVRSPSFLEAARRELERRRFGTGEVMVTTTRLNGTSVARGAALLALQGLFQSPFAPGFAPGADAVTGGGRTPVRGPEVRAGTPEG